MNQFTLCLVSAGESQTRYAKPDKPITEVEGKFWGYGDDPPEYLLKARQWKAVQFPTVGIYQGRLDVTKREYQGNVTNEVSLIVSSVHPVSEYVPVNAIALIGRVGGDPDVKYFESGSVKAAFSLAVSKGSDADPSWINIELWGKTAEVAANYVRKGRLIGIEGYLKFDSWIDKKTDLPRFKAIVKGDRLELLGRKDEQDSEQPRFDDEPF